MKQLVFFFLLSVMMLKCVAAQDESDYELSYYERVPLFKLIDQKGEDFGTAQLKRRVWIASFFFSRGGRECTVLMDQLARLQNRLEGTDILLVSFSVDSQFDQPEVLRQQEFRVGAREGQWYFLTGQKDLIWSLMKETFQLEVANATVEEMSAGAEAFVHSHRLALVDKNGYVRGYYDASDLESRETLTEDAKRLSFLT